MYRVIKTFKVTYHKFYLQCECSLTLFCQFDKELKTWLTLCMIILPNYKIVMCELYNDFQMDE